MLLVAARWDYRRSAAAAPAEIHFGGNARLLSTLTAPRSVPGRRPIADTDGHSVSIALAEMRENCVVPGHDHEDRLFFIGRLRKSAGHRELEGNRL